MDKRILSSSASGYIIIPKLVDNTYLLAIGFPKNEWPEFNISVNIKDTNAGFLLRNMEGEGWTILNLQGMKIIAAKKQQTNEEVKIVSSGDEFARILAQVVNDPSIAETVVVKKKMEAQANTEITENKIPKVLVVKDNTLAVLVDKLIHEAVPDKTEILRLNKESTSEGLLITYLDVDNTTADTVKIFMPVKKVEVTTENKKKTEEAVSVKKEGVKTSNSRFIDMELQNPNAKTDTGAKKTDDSVIMQKKEIVEDVSDEEKETAITTADTGKVIISSNCKKIADQNDFLELRKQMATDTSEKEMIKTATRQFVKNCFTTEQVKNLGVLFIAEEERYKFFVAAFPYVTDSNNFKTLEDQLSDNYYKTRFNVMFSR